MYRYSSLLQKYLIDTHEEEKPITHKIGIRLIELDTLDQYIYSINGWIFERNSQHEITHLKLWNTETWEWEAATKGTGTGQAVNVENFPAVISGTSVPIINDDLTSKYKITDIDSTEGNSYFGYVDKDGGWYIMQLTSTAARYIKGNSGYLAAWEDKGNLNYDYFHNIF